MSDLSLVTFEEMWAELTRRQAAGLYSGLVLSIAWDSDSQVLWVGGYHQALGLLEDGKRRMLDLRPINHEEPPDIEGEQP